MVDAVYSPLSDHEIEFGKNVGIKRGTSGYFPKLHITQNSIFELLDPVASISSGRPPSR